MGSDCLKTRARIDMPDGMRITTETEREPSLSPPVLTCPLPCTKGCDYVQARTVDIRAGWTPGFSKTGSAHAQSRAISRSRTKSRTKKANSIDLTSVVRMGILRLRKALQADSNLARPSLPLLLLDRSPATSLSRHRYCGAGDRRAGLL